MVTSTPFKSSASIYEWLSRFANMESGQTSRSFKLDRMLILAELASHPEKCAPSIHVAGSKGKGSVTGMIAAILEASGIKTGRYESPHVNDFRERIAMGKGFFAEETYISAGNELRELVKKLNLAKKHKIFDASHDDGEEPTFFELMTLWFFLCSRHAQVNAMAVETGMGGRLDATNILSPLVSVITLIELEHTEYLGKTIAAIAGEKAGIIKKGRPLILAEQTSEALEVFRKNTALKKSHLLYFPDYAKVYDIKINDEGTSFSLAINTSGMTGVNKEKQIYSDLFIPMPGEVQAKNAGLAILSVKAAFPQTGEEHIREGLAGFSLAARFEKISHAPAIVVDGAHTPHSLDLCLRSFASLYGKGAILIFGCAAGKDIVSMAKQCAPIFSRIIITRPGTFKKSFPDEIFTIFSREAENMAQAPEILFIPDTLDAIDQAIKLALENNLPVLGTGSFYLAGEIRNKVINNTNANCKKI